jgi:hypothetical protein
MDIKNLNDFYIDLNGDIKSSNGEKAEFLTTKDKLNSKYIKTEDINEIKEHLFKVNPNFKLDFEVLKQYSLKYDSNDNLIGVKLYVDYDGKLDNLNVILMGVDITSDKIEKDYYFIDNADSFLNNNNINYVIRDFETHKQILYSVKYNENNEVINFKTYYAINDAINYHSKEIYTLMKSSLKFN